MEPGGNDDNGYNHDGVANVKIMEVVVVVVKE